MPTNKTIEETLLEKLHGTFKLDALDNKDKRYIVSLFKDIHRTLLEERIERVREIEHWKCTDMGVNNDDYIVIRKSALSDILADDKEQLNELK